MEMQQDDPIRKVNAMKPGNPLFSSKVTDLDGMNQIGDALMGGSAKDVFADALGDLYMTMQFGSIKIQVNKYLPKNTMVVSEDVFQSLMRSSLSQKEG